MIIVALPAYNEEEAIIPLLSEIHRLLDGRFQGARIIVVDDGSIDGTAGRVRSYRGGEVELIQHEGNKGLAEAIKTGLVHALEASADSDVIVTMDADNTHNPGLMFRMASLIDEGNDVIIASRFVPMARIVGYPRHRRFLSRGASWFFRLLFPIKGVRDYTCGYRAYRAGVLREAFARWGDEFISQSGFSCLVDILLKLRRMGVVMNEVPLIMRYDLKPGQTKMDVKRTIKETLLLALRRRVGIDS
ncbi:MAG: glycosyltransferase [bacterium]|nr:glycosyltransferase [bacterium]